VKAPLAAMKDSSLLVNHPTSLACLSFGVHLLEKYPVKHRNECRFLLNFRDTRLSLKMEGK